MRILVVSMTWRWKIMTWRWKAGQYISHFSNYRFKFFRQQVKNMKISLYYRLEERSSYHEAIENFNNLLAEVMHIFYMPLKSSFQIFSSLVNGERYEEHPLTIIGERDEKPLLTK